MLQSCYQEKAQGQNRRSAAFQVSVNQLFKLTKWKR